MIDYYQDVDNPEAWLFDSSVRRDTSNSINLILL